MNKHGKRKTDIQYIQNQDHLQFGVHFIHINNILYHPLLRTPVNSDFRIKIQVSKYEYQIQCQYQQSCYPYELQYTETYQLYQRINPSIRAGPSWNDASTNMIEWHFSFNLLLLINIEEPETTVNKKYDTLSNRRSEAR